MMIACIGSRETPPEILEWQRKYAAKLVRTGHKIVTGNAPGADQAWADGANSVDPTKVVLVLPWATFEAHKIVPGNRVLPLESWDQDSLGYAELLASEHPGWAAQTKAGRKMYMRNVLVVHRAHRVIGSLNRKKSNGGGTGMAFDCAAKLQVAVFNCTEERTRRVLDAMVP